MLLIDIDRFKAINDQYGHLMGDKVLREVGTTMRQFFRRSDKVIRYGGDEFLVLLHATNLEAAQTVAANFIERAKGDLSHLLADRPITFSIGIAELDIGESGEKWLSRADRALYRSKQWGRSRVMVDDLNQLEILN